MPKCHTCRTDATSDTRQGECSICYKDDATFCATCAVWELGPVDSDNDFFPGLTKEKKKKSIRVQRQESTTSDHSTSSLAEIPLKCDGFLATMAKVCKMVEDQLKTDLGDPGPFTKDKPVQEDKEEESAYKRKVKQWEKERSDVVDEPINATLYGKPFAEYACKVLDNFQKLYPTCKYNRKAVQCLLVMHLSAQERVQDRWRQDEKGDSARKDVKLLKRWQTRELATKHLVHHGAAVGTHLGSTVRGLATKSTWLAALRCDDFELLLKGRKHPTLFAKDLLAGAGGNADKAKETLELCAILYQSLVTTRTKSELEGHWSQSESISSFPAPDALGLYSGAHREACFETEGSYTSDTKQLLNNIYDILAEDGVNKLPDHPRFADGNVSSNTRLDQVEKDYLRYLPVFDTTKSQASLRSECESIVRKRVCTMLKTVRDEFLKASFMRELYMDIKEVDVANVASKTVKYVDLDAANIGGGPHRVAFGKKTGKGPKNIRTDLDTTAKGAVSTFANAVKDPNYLSAFADKSNVRLEVKGPVHKHSKLKPRRKQRRTAVVNELKAQFEDFNGVPRYKYSTNTAAVANDGTVQPYDIDDYLDDVIAAMRDDFFVDQAIGNYVANLVLTKTDFSPKGWFPLNLEKHYLEELFPDCGFTEDTDPHIMTVNQHYEAWKSGTSSRPAHYLDWRNYKDLWLYDCFPIDPTRRPVFGSLSGQPRVPEPNSNYGQHTVLYDRQRTRARSIVNFGDKYAPRRSMLLLLDDVLYLKKRKDGSDAIGGDQRHKAIDDIMLRADIVKTWHGELSYPTLTEQWRRTQANKRKGYKDGNSLIECQIFGGVDVKQEILGFITIEEKLDNKLTAQQHLTSHYAGTLLPLPLARLISTAFTTILPNSAKSMFNKKAEDHTST